MLFYIDKTIFQERRISDKYYPYSSTRYQKYKLPCKSSLHDLQLILSWLQSVRFVSQSRHVGISYRLSKRFTRPLTAKTNTTYRKVYLRSITVCRVVKEFHDLCEIDIRFTINILLKFLVCIFQCMPFF